MSRSMSRHLIALSAAVCLAVCLAATPATAEPRPKTLAQPAKKHHKYFGSATDNPEFTDATVELRHLYGYSNADWTFTGRTPDTTWEPPDDLPSSHTAQLAEFLDGYEVGLRSDLGRPTMELVTALYKAAITGRPVLRGEIGAADPFYASLHGGRPEVFR